MKRTKWIALLLAVSLLAGMVTTVSAVTTAPITPAFTDISDPNIAESADLLRLLGIVNGTGGTSFRPQGTLTRSEFCKMAVELLGEGGKAASQMNRTIFRDVPSTHWARGYIHVAAQTIIGGEGSKATLIRGDGSGSFHPDTPISYAEAVTILMRVLGYSDDTVGFGSAWYDGYLSTAAQVGLTDGVSAAPLASITRGEAAILFANVLYTDPRNAKDPYLVSALGGSIMESQLVLEVKGQATSEGGWALRTAEKSYRTRRDNLSAAYQGQRCQLVLDKDGDVLALQKDADYTTRTVRVLSAEARYVMAQGQEQILVDPATPVYQGGQSKSTYGDTYAKQMPYGTNAVFCYDKAGALQSIYLLTGDSGSITAVALPGTDPFRSMFSSVAPTVYKNGVPASLTDVKPYDVGTFDGNADILNLSDRKLTGVYENATPSAVSPSKITVMGETFDVLDCALKDLINFKLGDKLTLLLDGNNNVAGVVSPEAVSGEVFGVATIQATPHTQVDDKGNVVRTWHTFEATVELSIGKTVKGEVSSTVPAAQRAPGQLVSVTSYESGQLRLTPVTSAAAPGAWRPLDGKLGSLNVSPQVAVYDRVGSGPLVKVTVAQATAPSIAAGKITYFHTDSHGSVDVIILNDATGDGHTYGLADFDKDTSSNPTLKVSNGGEGFSAVTNYASEGLDGAFIGAAPALSSAGGSPRLDSTVTLRSVQRVRRTAFTEDSVTINGVTYPLSSSIDDCCYNAKAKTWFSSLDEALAYTSSLTVYYDRLPDQGGKIRLVVAE